jgi:hypothetical protein
MPYRKLSGEQALRTDVAGWASGAKGWDINMLGDISSESVDEITSQLSDQGRDPKEIPFPPILWALYTDALEPRIVHVNPTRMNRRGPG